MFVSFKGGHGTITSAETFVSLFNAQGSPILSVFKTHIHVIYISPCGSYYKGDASKLSSLR